MMEKERLLSKIYAQEGGYFESSMVLTLVMIVGGFMNAYTYLLWGGVFANNQTANMSKLGIDLVLGHTREAGLILLSIASALLGAILAAYLNGRWIRNMYRWRQVLLTVQILFFVAVSCLPADMSPVYVTTPFSFIASFQLSAFRTLRGRPCNTTICTGNLRTAGGLISDALSTRKAADVWRATEYSLIVFSFVLGALLGALLVLKGGVVSILWAEIPLALVLAGSLLKPKGLKQSL